MRLRSASLLAPLTAMLLTGCISAHDAPTAPELGDASAVASTFDRLSDSLAASGGDASLVASYASLAAAVRTGGRITPVLITIDGVPTRFMATAQLTESSFAPCNGQICAALPASVVRPIVTRSLIAWQANDPRRVVQLTSASDAERIGALLVPTFAPSSVPTALLVYLDGRGGTWFGTSGTQAMTAATTETPCSALPGARPTSAVVSSLRCTNASFTASFSGIVEPSRFLVRGNTATGTHTLAMPTQPVLGIRLQYTVRPCSPVACLPVTGGGPLPPIDVQPSAQLPATLTATPSANGDVAFAFTVSNTTSADVSVGFNSGQRLEVVVEDAATGVPVWKSSADQLFTMALANLVIPARGSLTLAQSWKPVAKGSYTAIALLSSYTHRASARVGFEVK